MSADSPTPAITRMRNLQPGDRFMLLRSGQRYDFIAREGWHYIVRRDGVAKSSTLHHSCHVRKLEAQA